MTASPTARLHLNRSRVAQRLGRNIQVSPWTGWLHCFRSDFNSNMLIHPARSRRFPTAMPRWGWTPPAAIARR